MNSVSPSNRESGQAPGQLSRRSELTRPELLAPAGDWECARAAVENGADAIYFGLERFNARMRARNFTEADLPALMEFLHARGVRGYVTLNTLVFENELADAEHYIRSIVACGADAAIVQDVGICRLIRDISPDFPIHASTQMTITSAAGVEFARELGCQLVVLARECSLSDISKIRATFESPSNSPARGLPLEVFVHGALCVAYSGQCLTSESLGGRSANRGECAQACRMPYELVSDGQTIPLGDQRYLLSPQDLASVEVLPELVTAGVNSLKIEGRLKSPEYVASITRVYRQALDKIMAALSTSNDALPAGQKLARDLHRRSEYEMEMAFSRGLYTGWFRGIDNQQLVHGRFGKKRGVFLGEVQQVAPGAVFLELKAPLRPGDGVVFDSGHPDQNEEGGRVYKVSPSKALTRVEFGRDNIDFSRVHAGARLWKTSDPELDRELRRTFHSEKPQFQRPVDMAVHGEAGTPLTLILRDEIGHVVQVTSHTSLIEADRHPLNSERLRQQLGRLGGTAFQLRHLENLLIGSVILPMSELNRLRREAVDQLQTLRARPQRWTIRPTTVTRNGSLPSLRQKSDNSPDSNPSSPELVVLVRSLEQLQTTLQSGVGTIYCEFEDPKKYRDAVALFRRHHSERNTQHEPVIFVAPPRISKPGEEWILKQVRSCEADGYLIRNYDHLSYFKDTRRIGDFSLNVANGLTADYFKRHFDLEHVTASYDLNAAQLEALLGSAPPGWFEITIHQHMPMFHMEHCVFCAFLSTGTDYRNCGRPCDTHQVLLRDRVGAQHPLKADAGCRNTVFNALAQTGAESLTRFLALGARRFRIEFLNETPSHIETTIDAYRKLLRGQITGTQLWRELKLLNQLGVTRGAK